MSAPEKTIGIIVARMTSSRLPGKVLRMVNGKPLLAYTLERLKAVHGLDEIWLASTQHPSDESLLLWGIQQDMQVLGYPGEIDDVVGRISAVLNRSKADRFLMVLGDTPFADTRYMNKLLQALDEHPEWETASVDRSEKPAVHSGIACYRASGWRKIESASQEAKYREHPASILKDQPDLVLRGTVEEEPLYYEGPYRLTVDTQADLEFADKIATALQKPDEIISLAEILHYLRANPDLSDMNTHVRQKTIEDLPLKILMAAQVGGDYGTGHLARCKTIARTLEENFSAGVTFWLDSPNAKFRRDLTEEGCNVVEGNWSLAEAIRQGDYTRVVIDFQTPVTPSMIFNIRQTRPELPIIIMDNNGLGAVEADAVIFPNAHSQPNTEWMAEQKHMYQGGQYIVLGAGFLSNKSDWPDMEPLSLPSLLITMGGRDPELSTEKVLDALKDLKDCHIDLVVPPMYPYPENLEKIATMLPSTITLHWRISNLRPLMQRATLAVAAFGITAYELAYMGLPAILLGHYKSQEEDMERFVQWGSAISLGWGKTLDSEKLYILVCELIQDSERRALMSEKGKALVDLKGPLRVAEAIVATTREPLSVVQD